MGLTVMNRGRRPIKLTGYGLLFSNGMRSQYNPYAIATLPFTLTEGDSYLGYLPKRKVQEDVRDNHAKGVRLSAVYVDTADNQRLTKRFGRGDETVAQLLTGELAPEPTNLDLMDPALRLRTIGQR